MGDATKKTGRTTGDVSEQASATVGSDVKARDPVTFERRGVECPSCRQPMKYAADAKEGERVAITCGTPGCVFDSVEVTAGTVADPKLGEAIAAGNALYDGTMYPMSDPADLPFGHCWKCHIEVERTEARVICHGCCDALEEGESRAMVLAGELVDLRSEHAEMLALLREARRDVGVIATTGDGRRRRDFADALRVKMDALLARIDGGGT